jgi:hypothetical protein
MRRVGGKRGRLALSSEIGDGEGVSEEVEPLEDQWAIAEKKTRELKHVREI